MKGLKICLFDVDGTLTQSRLKIDKNMVETLRQLSKRIDIAVVGGSDLSKIRQQLDEQSLTLCKYIFSQNGLVTIKDNSIIGCQQINHFLGEQKLQQFINYCLKYMSELLLPVKRGTFIQYRSGMINISPIGRNCSQQQRNHFEKYDAQHKVRQKFITALRLQFPNLKLTYSIGGQISFDVVPQGWDKTYCLKYLKDYDQIYFFGDKTYKGGNDFQIYEKVKVIGKAFSISKGPSQTIQILSDLFLKQ